jgi:hypothetical protein
MRPSLLPLGVRGLLLPACLLALTACSKSDTPGAPIGSAQTTSGPKPTGATGLIGAAKIGGQVLFHGPVPAFREPSAPFPECGERTPQDPLQVSQSGGVANAFVYIKDGLPPGDYPLPTAPVLLDQKACDYHPRVFGIRAGQPLQIRNSDPVLHNVHSRGAGAGLAGGPNAFNVAMPVQGMSTTRSFPEPQVPVSIGCDVHPWMRAFAGVVSHPFFAVTGADGSFSLENLPAGTYTLEAWHERLGRTTAQVIVSANAAAQVQLEFKP